MPKVLITAYGPYGDYPENASWLALQELTRDLPEHLETTTRLYPVDFDEARKRIAKDLAEGFDAALHLGQSPGSGAIELEAFAVNVRRAPGQAGCEARPLVEGGPPAYRSALPLESWASLLREAGIPADVSFHAGDFLCNAALYWSHYFAEQAGQAPLAAFLHLPLDTSQAVRSHKPMASLPAATSAQAIRLLLETIRSPAAKEGVA